MSASFVDSPRLLASRDMSTKKVPVDLRLCQGCHRPSRFFGNRDKETGWEGWCSVCNWVWRFGDVTRVIQFRILEKLPLLGGEVQGALCVFLAGEACYAQVLSGSARSELRQVEENAMRMILVSHLIRAWRTIGPNVGWNNSQIRGVRC